ncbi:MAG: hypothetical protein H6737_29040 [Alphaproteobacteria bacterium]|nr:hypothetical protein [Alphaproteobacteria bacterium]
MDFQVSDDAPFSRDLVFRTHRDEFERIAPRLSEVERVVLKSQSTAADGTIEQKHEWFGHPSALPFFIRPLVPPEMLRWFGHTRWNPRDWECRWSVEVPALGPMADIQGFQRYHETPTGCRIELTGTFDFHPDRVPQVRLPPGSVPVVERFVVSLIVPMMQKSAAAVIDHLKSETR